MAAPHSGLLRVILILYGSSSVPGLLNRSNHLIPFIMALDYDHSRSKLWGGFDILSPKHVHFVFASALRACAVERC
ncbi:hypothetical protein QBC41DRAFT_309938 [Cercophora samala]|uniref:Secreted protein n=1 Tax=Cercophora samala TaxID=330535 RepID=A0AA39ZNF2_9PEZI|nr:hypothetical protein QBC41DRAFT_309938 [Cercophora samala]